MRPPGALAIVLAGVLLLAGCTAPGKGPRPADEPLDNAADPGKGQAATHQDTARNATPTPAIPPTPAVPTRPPTPPTASPIPKTRPHVVVAVIDTGINPYHAMFRASAAPPVSPALLADQGYPSNATALPITLGSNYENDRKADLHLWSGVKGGQLYWFPGTRIVGAISLGLDGFANSAPNAIPVLDEDGHGTATSSRVAQASPEALLVMVEVGGSSLNDGIAWAAAQPWIDVISISAGPLVNAPLDWPAYRFGGVDIPTRAAWDAGKIVFVAAGNTPDLGAGSSLAGAPWDISVGGALPESHADAGAQASKAMDIVSDYDPIVARHDSADGTKNEAGTSFASPTAAGTAAQALLKLRQQQGWAGGIADHLLIPAGGPGMLSDGLANGELRAAINATAHYWDTASWSPVVGVPQPLPEAPAPWVQMGWGYLGANDSEALVQVIDSGKLPAKPAEAVLYQGNMFALREAVWG